MYASQSADHATRRLPLPGRSTALCGPLRRFRRQRRGRGGSAGIVHRSRSHRVSATSMRPGPPGSARNHRIGHTMAAVPDAPPVSGYRCAAQATARCCAPRAAEGSPTHERASQPHAPRSTPPAGRQQEAPPHPASGPSPSSTSPAAATPAGRHRPQQRSPGFPSAQPCLLSPPDRLLPRAPSPEREEGSEEGRRRGSDSDPAPPSDSDREAGSESDGGSELEFCWGELKDSPSTTVGP